MSPCVQGSGVAMPRADNCSEREARYKWAVKMNALREAAPPYIRVVTVPVPAPVQFPVRIPKTEEPERIVIGFDVRD